MKFVYPSGSRPLEGFTIKRGVGVGGFGEVYYAVSDAGKEVALKRILRNLDIEIRGVTQCLNLKHINLIALYDVRYDDQGEAWVVMEYVSGESLKDRLDQSPHGLPLDEVLHWFEGIAAGVRYLHEHGIVHRDLKPGNIFTDEDVVKIGDYGLSKFISCSRRSGQTESVGTFHYMAPEIGKGVYGKEIDVYALGIILYELLTGRVPFEGESSQEIIMKHLTAEPALDGVAVPYREVIRRALLKDPEQRYHSVAEMLVAFRRATRPGRAADAVAEAIGDTIVDAEKAGDDDVFYIGEETEPDEGMQFGPLRQTPSAEKPSPRARAKRDGSSGEPVAAAVARGWRRLAQWWSQANLSMPLKVLLLLGGIALLVLNGTWLIPLAIITGAVYLVYFGVRSIVLALSEPATKQAVPPVQANRTAQAPRPTGNSPAAKPRRRRSWQQEARVQLARKRVGEHTQEVLSSMLTSALVCGVLALVMLVLAGQITSGINTWVMYAWLTLCSVGVAWTVLLAGKFWESDAVDPLWRRFILLVLGLLMGTAAWGADGLLMADLNGAPGLFAVSDLPGGMYSGQQPQLPAFLTFFVGLLVVLRWWKQTDPLRHTRLSIFATVVTVLWAWILPFAWPWGLMLAATSSVAVQMSAPWLNREQRNEVRTRLLEA